jgi:hypothetical protein
MSHSIRYEKISALFFDSILKREFKLDHKTGSYLSLFSWINRSTNNSIKVPFMEKISLIRFKLFVIENTSH